MKLMKPLAQWINNNIPKKENLRVKRLNDDELSQLIEEGRTLCLRWAIGNDSIRLTIYFSKQDVKDRNFIEISWGSLPLNIIQAQASAGMYQEVITFAAQIHENVIDWFSKG